MWISFIMGGWRKQAKLKKLSACGFHFWAFLSPTCYYTLYLSLYPRAFSPSAWLLFLLRVSQSVWALSAHPTLKGAAHTLTHTLANALTTLVVRAQLHPSVIRREPVPVKGHKAQVWAPEWMHWRRDSPWQRREWWPPLRKPRLGWRRQLPKPKRGSCM